MDEARTSPRNMIIAFTAAVTLAVAGWVAVGGSTALETNNAGKSTGGSGWR